MDEQELWQTWDSYGSRLTWLEVLRRASTEQSQRVAQRTLDELPRVTAIQALAANAQLVELLISRRMSCRRHEKPAPRGWMSVPRLGCQARRQRTGTATRSPTVSSLSPIFTTLPVHGLPWISANALVAVCSSLPGGYTER